MIRVKYLLIGLLILILTSFTLAGCGISQADYDELLAQKTALETKNKALESEKATLESEKQSLQADYDKLNSDYDALKDENESLQENYNTVNNELTQIKNVYPPRDFSSRSELEDWLEMNDVSEKPKSTTAEAWIGRALEVQEDALMDGYIVSVDYDGPDEAGLYLIFCTTIINGYIWYWDPETDEITQDINFIPVN